MIFAGQKYLIHQRIFDFSLGLFFTLIVCYTAVAQAESLAGAEQFAPNSSVQSQGWANIYDPNNNELLLLPFLEIDGMAVHGGDMVLGPITNFQTPSTSSGSGIQYGVATNNLGSRWDNGIVYYDLNGHPASAVIQDAFEHIEENTSIRFLPKGSQSKFVRFIDGSGCWSYIGRLNSSQDLSIQTPGCNFLGTISHELFHALGVYHEQSRSDRNSFISINFENIRDGLEGNFQVAGNSSDIGPYDYGSIMHYSRRAFSKNGLDTITTPAGISIGNRSALSPGDIETMQTIYYTDLSLDLTTVTSVNPGGTVSVDFTINNPGNDPDIGSIIAKDVKVTLPRPNQSSYTGFSSSDSWDCTLVSQTVECTLEILDRNDSTALTLNFTAPTGLGSMQFEATVSASNADPDTSNNEKTATVTITGNSNNAPTVSISAPGNNSSFVQGSSITFIGNASDAEDGDISSNIVWSSNLDGNLNTGASFSKNNLQIGTHTITASIIDSDGANDSSTLTLTVSAPLPPPNTAPVVSISAPGNGSSFVQGSSITFTGSASDAEDGNISGDIVWSSNLDGNLNTAASFSKSNLQIGTHTITASITDSDGAIDSSTLTLTVSAPPPPPNTAPVVSISAPGNGSSFVQGNSITFTGSASDAEDGNISSDIVWSSNLDGNLNTGASFSKSNLQIGTHTITASITDSDGDTHTRSITLQVTAPANIPPVVSITAPTAGSSFIEGDNIVFSGIASDIEDGDISNIITWSSDLDGDLDSGASINVNTLSVGVHTITATVTDTANATETNTIMVTVSSQPTNAPTVMITAPANQLSFEQGDEITFTASAADTEDGDLSDDIDWYSDLDGKLGSGASLSVTTLSVGTHRIIALIADSNAAKAASTIKLTVVTATTDGGSTGSGGSSGSGGTGSFDLLALLILVASAFYRLTGRYLAVVAVGLLSACQTTNARADEVIYIGSELVDCMGVVPQKCMQVKKNKAGDWTFFYDQIEGFEYLAGYQYKLLIETYDIENPPADASAIGYRLIKMVGKKCEDC